MKGKNYEHTLLFTLEDIRKEVMKAKNKYPNDFNSIHEGYAVLLEEVDELWDEVKKKDFNSEAAKKEAIQAAAMLCRFLVELL